MKSDEKQKKDSDLQKSLQRLKDLRPIDDDFMRCIFKDDIPLTQHVLRIITGIEDLEIISVKTQADMKRLAGARSLCLDVYGTDSTGKKYDMEVQRADKGAGAHRARYHSSVMDIENLDAGNDFEALPDTYTIFITENDIYGKGIPFYPIERINLGTGEPFADGGHILYVNGAYEGDDAIGILMHDFRCSNPDDMLDEKLSEKTRYYKKTEEGMGYMCKAIEDMLDERTIDNTVDFVSILMKNTNFPLEQAMDTLEIPVEVREIVKSRIIQNA